MKNKNILFVFADQWRRCSVGAYHDDPVITPNMDEFASNSMVCTNANSACPLCSPARASMLSGLYPLSTGVFTNCKNGSDIRLKDDDVCIGEVLKQKGYHTGYIGKWHLDEPEINNDPAPVSGAKKWDAYTPPGIRRHGFDFWHAYNASDNHTHPHYWENTSQSLSVCGWSPEHETDVAIQYMDMIDKEHPFALFVSWNPPHSPYDTAPQKYKDLYESTDYLRGNVDVDALGHTMHHTFEPVPLDGESAKQLTRDYFAAITGLDDQFGRLIAYLKEQDLYDDTVIVLTADHGDMLGSHTLIGKHVWYEESVGIPFIIGGAGIKPGTCETVFGSQDMPATLLSLLGIDIPKTWEGHDISQNIINGTTDDGSYTFLAACPGRDVFIEEFKKHDRDILSYGWRAVRDRRYTYVISVGYRIEPLLEYYLFDNIEDPLQLTPRTDEAARNDSNGKRLEELLVSWLERQGDPFLHHLQHNREGI